MKAVFLMSAAVAALVSSTATARPVLKQEAPHITFRDMPSLIPHFSVRYSEGRAMFLVDPRTTHPVIRVTWPAHDALWRCLGSHESHSDPHNQDTGHNGHYGFLQMHPGWGHGTSFYASEDSQLVQENAAEDAYRESGYSHWFLVGQWGQTLGFCEAYA